MFMQTPLEEIKFDSVHLFSAPSSLIYLVVTGKVYTCLNEGNDPPNEGVAMET